MFILINKFLIDELLKKKLGKYFFISLFFSI